MSKINIIPIFVPHLGCPNNCVFCNQRKISGTVEFSVEDAIEKIEYFLKSFGTNKEIEIAFYGGSFTAIDKDLQFELLKIANKYKSEGKVDRIRLSTRPDAIDREICEYLKCFDVDVVEIGVQSLDEEVLRLSKRNHSIQSVYDACDLLREFQFVLGIQQMIGLPGDNFEKTIKTTEKIIKIRPDLVRIYPTLVIKNTELEDMYYSGEYKSLELEDAVDIVSKLIMLYEANDISIARVGLQSSDNLQFGKDVVAGPLHDAFRELCESEILYSVIRESHIIPQNNDIIISGSDRNVSIIVGQHGKNKERIKELLCVDKINFKRDNNLKDEIRIYDGEEEISINISEQISKIVKGFEYVSKEH